MRVIRYTIVSTLACILLLSPGSASAAASKEQQEMQRDIASLSDQVKELQKANDAKFGALQQQLQQMLDMANKTNTSVGSLNSGLMQTLQTELKNMKAQLAESITGLSVKEDNTANNLSDLKGLVESLVSTVNKQQLVLNDINSQLKLMAAPPAAPPGGAVGPAIAPQPTAQSLFESGVRDMGPHPEIALTEFTEFLHLYPNDGNAAGVQYHIGEIHYGQGSADQAAKDFDTVIEQGPSDQQLLSQSYYMKGMALRKANKNTEAIKVFRDTVKNFPRTPAAGQAADQLTAMGANRPATGKKK